MADVLLVLFIPAAMVAASAMSYWTGKYLERRKLLKRLNGPLTDSGEAMADTLGEGIDRASDRLGGPAGPASQDTVFLARVRSPIGGEKSLVIVDDGRTTPEATRTLKRQFPISDVQQVSRVRLFQFDHPPDSDQQDPSDRRTDGDPIDV